MRKKIKKNSAPKSADKIQSRPFVLPESFLNQLEEFTSGGYFLLNIDDQGQPTVNCNFDNPITMLGYIHYMRDFCDALEHNYYHSHWGAGESSGGHGPEDCPEEDNY